MGIVNLPAYGTDPVTVNASNLNGKVDPLATEFNGNIENVNIKNGAQIANSKLNLATMAQAIAMSSKEFLFAKGADVASGTSIALGTDGNCFDITGTTTIQTITAKQAGSVVWLHFDGALTLTDDTGNLELQGSDLTVAAEDEVILKSDGTNWHLVAFSGGVYESSSPTWTGTHDFSSATVTFGLTSSDLPAGTVLQVVKDIDTAVATTEDLIPFDDIGPPLFDEGLNVLSATITPASTSNFIRADVTVHLASSVTSNHFTASLFEAGSGSDACIACGIAEQVNAAKVTQVTFSHYFNPAAASSTVYNVNIGMGGAGTCTFNGHTGARIGGGVLTSSLILTEIKG